MPTRAVIYARYSSDQQRSASIADQVEVCRRYIERQGWALTGTYDDAAASGASTLTRPGYQRLMQAAQASAFDVVVTEAIDRLGRNLSDVAHCFDQLSFPPRAVARCQPWPGHAAPYRHHGHNGATPVDRSRPKNQTRAARPRPRRQDPQRAGLRV